MATPRHYPAHDQPKRGILPGIHFEAGRPRRAAQKIVAGAVRNGSCPMSGDRGTGYRRTAQILNVPGNINGTGRLGLSNTKGA